MNDYRILIADGLEPAGLDILNAAARVEDLTGIGPDALLNVLPGADALIVRSRTKVTQTLLEAAQDLKVIGRAGVGVDSIDLAAARGRGVTVVNSPIATTGAVAELALGLMLALARSIPQADASMKKGAWEKKTLKGVELAGKTLGIIGVGNIGAALAALGTALGMEVLGYDAWLTPEKVRANGAAPVELAELYRRADYISLHVPLTDETRGMIGTAALASMKPGVRLVCTARGAMNSPSGQSILTCTACTRG